MTHGFQQLQEAYINEIADNYIDAPEVARRLDSMCEIMLGERIPVHFVSKDTGEILVPANKKLTRSILRELVIRWLEGKKFDIKLEDKFAGNTTLQGNIASKILAAIEPDFEWHQAPQG